MLINIRQAVDAAFQYLYIYQREALGVEKRENSLPSISLFRRVLLSNPGYSEPGDSPNRYPV
ncbi:hypothetical protein [Okeania sp. SIO2C2]|uniref:hypothetical protein n=1 Tax=Okeania sp. SIO2C2 TaxID=2607787 RepID=UPI00257A160C|nr:hypothetical protein [Okeania sp. SIO2C2]